MALEVEGCGTSGATIHAEDTVESIALAGADAIQHLIFERNEFRNRARALEEELAVIRSTNEDQRRRIGFVHNQYLSLTSKFVAHLNDIDKVISNNLHNGDKPIINGPDASLTSLAKRFSPAVGDQTS